MASAITLTGIDRAISRLEYVNENTLKCKFIRHIRQYYTDDDSIASLKAIDLTALIKLLWNTGDDPEAIKNKRKSLNSLRSSVNADLKKLYEKGINAEGIKISPDNIFVMSEDAKDNILNTFGYELEPDGTLKLDQIMDILKLANDTVSDPMTDENSKSPAYLSKKDQLKDLIERLSEKLGLGAPVFSKTDSASESQQSEPQVLPDNIGKAADIEALDEDEVISGIEDFEEEEVLEEIDDIKEDETLDELEELEEDILGDTEDSGSETIVLEEETDKDLEDPADDASDAVDDITELGEEEIEEVLEDEADDEDAELEVIDVVQDDGSGSGDGVGGQGAEESGTGDKYFQENGGLDGRSGQGACGNDPEETGSMIGNSRVDSETGQKGEGTGIGVDATGKGDENSSGFEEAHEVPDDDAPDAVDEITELDDLDEIEAPDEDDVPDDVDDEILGLPIDSLGQEYRSEKDTAFKSKLLAEAFDGYLGSMDRYYNHYILIDGGEYVIGSRHPKKNEIAEHTVHLDPFYLGRFPVTNGLFEIFVEKTGYKTTAEKIGYGTVYYGRFEKRKDEQTGLTISKWNASLYYKVLKGACWYRPSGPESTLHNKRDHPVVQISLEDAAAFAAWTGKRLPTENEWEAASRTGKGWVFPWGNEWKKDAGNIEDCGIADTTPVDKYAEFENNLGIVDVLGNVLEWTDNGFGIPYQENNASTCRIAKGGSWVSGTDIRLFSRFILEPDSHSNILGFRCVAY
jgi:formylglycine-generating enzyme required for sulfatase activity